MNYDFANAMDRVDCDYINVRSDAYHNHMAEQEVINLVKKVIAIDLLCMRFLRIKETNMRKGCELI